MIERIVELSARHRFFVLTVVAVIAVAGWQSMARMPLDALPETGGTQVIVRAQWDRSPDLIDSQVTYPIVSALLGAPGVRSVRGISDYGSSLIYILFDDGVDLYWARSRTLEYLSAVTQRLPSGAFAELGPDATALGWVFQYVLVDRSGQHDLAQLRAYQDWYLNYYLRAVPGVAEVAAVGGFVRQYQVNVDPNRLRAYGIPIERVTQALRNGNRDVGGRVLESGGAEYVVRGLGYAHSVGDLEEILLASAEDGTPIRIRDIGRVTVGSDFRRGVTDLDGTGEAVSGIVIMRQGQNALDVIDRVKGKIHQIEASLPAGMQVETIYDRSDLIHRSVDNLEATILEVIVTVSLVILLFLWHVPSTIVPLVTIPVTILAVFLPLQLLGISSNIMSLGGIAIAIGAMVDASIVVVEQTHKNLEIWDRSGRSGPPGPVILSAIQQISRPSSFALLVIAVSFLPVMALQGEEGSLFRPLAYTKSIAMVVGAILTITLDPALRILFTRVVPFSVRPAWLGRIVNTMFVGSIRAEEKHPLNRWLMSRYEPVVRWSMDHKFFVIGGVFAILALTIPVWQKLGAEFMPRLEEGAILYMPTTMPGISVQEAGKLLQVTDRILKQFPEVDRVLGKAGRADTATDPAPLSMIETYVLLRPETEWRRVPTWYSYWAPQWLSPVLRHFTPDTISKEQLVKEMDQALKLPGTANAWTMPIRGRIDMLNTGLRTPVGLKISGTSLEEIERVGLQIVSVLPYVAGTRGVFAERLAQGYFVDVKWDRTALAHNGLSIEDAQTAVQHAVGGETITSMVKGRERYPVSLRYLADYRTDVQALGRVLVPSSNGERQIPVSELAEIQIRSGPTMLRDEDGLMTGYVYVDVTDDDLAGYVQRADKAIHDKLNLPAGYSVSWSGQYEGIIRTKQRLTAIIPLTLLLIFLLLYWNTRSITKTWIVLLAVPFSVVGAVWFLFLLGYHLSAAVWVGLIALMGVDAETGVFMLLYLDRAFQQAGEEGRLESASGLREAVVEGAARRLRPKLMTVATMFLGLVPIMWSSGAGSDVMKRIAAPMIGGIFTSFVLELVVYPVVYHWWRSRFQIGTELTQTTLSH
jgi:copper/silver efflux system protein